MSSIFFIAEIAVFIVSIIYFLLILWFYEGWRKLKPQQNPVGRNLITVSVIVPVRNEAVNIEKLIRDLLIQDYAPDLFEILIIDDHSEDGTNKIVSGKTGADKKLKLFALPDGISGKKAAIAYGIEKSNGEMILQTDGDCRVPVTWISSMVQSYKESSGTFVSGAVRMEGPRTLFASLQELEFFSLLGSTGGAIGVRHPLMCNGANLAFSKAKYLKLSDALNMNFASGDDVFLMFAFHQQHAGKMVFNKSREGTIVTETADTLQSFFLQRKRWVSKSRGYQNLFVIGTALIVLLQNAGLLLLLVSSLFDIAYLNTFILFFCLKSMADLVLLNSVLAFYNRRSLLFLFPIAQLMYIFYVTITAITGIWGTFTWKGRNYQV
jgi:cellulose synthase/poly-beta-1,6-N-acetylglucosamine synthase-like glycosyltransferase